MRMRMPIPVVEDTCLALEAGLRGQKGRLRQGHDLNIPDVADHLLRQFHRVIIGEIRFPLITRIVTSRVGGGFCPIFRRYLIS